MKYEEKSRMVEGAEVAVLFIHGILGSPNHFDRFYELVPENVSYQAILLRGHGRRVQDFSKSNMNEWREDSAVAVENLLKSHKQIILVAHSMGTLFSIQESVKHPDRVKALFLLNSPMKAYLHPCMILGSFKVLSGKVKAGDERGEAMIRSYSLERDWRLWRYLAWIPRFLELFSEIKATRKIIGSVTVKTQVFQSKNDELVRNSATKYLMQNKDFDITTMKNSTHFYYEKEDFNNILTEFKKLF